MTTTEKTTNSRFVDLTTCRSYSTMEQLQKGLQRYHIADVPHCVVQNSAGRYVPIFSLNVLDKHHVSLVAVANRGFPVFG